MNRPEHERLADWDGAYALGALTSADRRVYEGHMEHCFLCRDAVSELSSMPGLLAQIRPESDLPEHPQEPGDLMDAMLDKDRRRSAGRRRLLGWAAAAVAVLVLAIAIPLP